MHSESDEKLHQLQQVFAGLFRETERTLLVRSEGEPLYVPADATRAFAEIRFAHGFFSSALHEIAHWLIAGESRRQLVDFGYWYRPDGRTAGQQAEFERFEARNQGLEWILAVAASHPFHVSTDNLTGPGSGVNADGREFAEKVRNNALEMLDRGLRGRTAMLVEALVRRFSAPGTFKDYWTSVRRGNLLPAY